MPTDAQALEAVRSIRIGRLGAQETEDTPDKAAVVRRGWGGLFLRDLVFVLSFAKK